MVGLKYQSRAGAGAARRCRHARAEPSGVPRMASLMEGSGALIRYDCLLPGRLPLAFVAIHPAVARRQQGLIAVAVVWKHRRTGTHHPRDADVGPHLEADAVDGLLQLAPLALRFFAAATRDDDDELVARVAHADVVR